MDTTSDFTHTLREQGFKVTAQRLAVYQTITEYGRHLTAEQVYERVSQALPTISLTTVYKILNELVDLGKARRISLGDGSVRFDPNVDSHAHLVCRRCGQAEDLPATEYHAGVPDVARRGYLITDQAVVFYGLCPRCRAEATAPPEAR